MRDGDFYRLMQARKRRTGWLLAVLLAGVAYAMWLWWGAL